MAKLKEKQELFCQNYFITRNATKAAQSAGYSEQSAYNQGYRLLKQPDIQDRLKELESEVSTDLDVITELEQQYEAAKLTGSGQVALKALELLSRVRGNNQEDEGPTDLEGLEESIKHSFQTIGKEKVYELLMQTFPEDFDDEEEEDKVDADS
jgi:phage terminase small subunit